MFEASAKLSGAALASIRDVAAVFYDTFLDGVRHDALKDMDNADLLADLREVVSGPATTLQEADKQLLLMRSTRALWRMLPVAKTHGQVGVALQMTSWCTATYQGP